MTAEPSPVKPATVATAAAAVPATYDRRPAPVPRSGLRRALRPRPRPAPPPGAAADRPPRLRPPLRAPRLRPGLAALAEVARDSDPVGWVRAAAYEYALAPWQRWCRDTAPHPRPRTPEEPLRPRCWSWRPPPPGRAPLRRPRARPAAQLAAEIEASTVSAAGRITRARERWRRPYRSWPTKSRRVRTGAGPAHCLAAPRGRGAAGPARGPTRCQRARDAAPYGRGLRADRPDRRTHHRDHRARPGLRPRARRPGRAPARGRRGGRTGRSRARPVPAPAHAPAPLSVPLPAQHESAGPPPAGNGPAPTISDRVRVSARQDRPREASGLGRGLADLDAAAASRASSLGLSRAGGAGDDGAGVAHGLALGRGEAAT